jgi:hypothetical protein
MMIEEMLLLELYTRSSQQENYQRLVEYDRAKRNGLEGIARTQEHIKDLQEEKKKYLANIQEALTTKIAGIQELREKAQKEKEIEEILAKEIKEYRGKWEQYLATKPLPALPKSKVKKLGNKLKTEFKQVFKTKELPKPIKSNVFNILLVSAFIR